MHEHLPPHPAYLPQLLLALPFAIALSAYLLAVSFSNRRCRPWPVSRTIGWAAGTICATAAVWGPIADRAHADFTAHKIGHLLLGMLAPLLMASGTPMTLLLRTLNARAARIVTRWLRSRYSRFLTDPVVASLFNVGALWIVYATDLYAAMHKHVLLQLAVHAHMFLAGYLFTVAMIDADPMPHRASYAYRSGVLVLALASHGILAKTIYAQPPAGVDRAAAEAGAMLMYYGGDLVDAVIVFLLCLGWYRSGRATASRNTRLGRPRPPLAGRPDRPDRRPALSRIRQLRNDE